MSFVTSYVTNFFYPTNTTENAPENHTNNNGENNAANGTGSTTTSARLQRASAAPSEPANTSYLTTIWNSLPDISGRYQRYQAEKSEQQKIAAATERLADIIVFGDTPETAVLPKLKSALEDGAQLKDAQGKDIVDDNNNKRTALHLAAAQGAGTFIKPLMKHGANVNSVDLTKATPLHLAVAARKPQAAIALINYAKADIALKDQCGNTPLHTAVSQPNTQNEAVFNNILRAYRTHSGFSDALDIRNDQDQTPIETALDHGKMDAAKALLPAYTSVNSQGTLMQRTLLHSAINRLNNPVNNSGEFIAQLLEKDGIDFDLKDRNGNTALHYCFENIHKPAMADLALTLIDLGASIYTTNNDGETLLHLFSKMDNKANPDNEENIKKLANKLRDILKSNQANVNSEGGTQSATDLCAVQNKQGETPLHVALKHNNTLLIDLLAEISPLDVRDNDGFTPLHLAAQTGALKPFEVLSTYDNDKAKQCINLEDEEGRTALHHAYHSKTQAKGSAKFSTLEQIIKKMLDLGANTEISDHAGNYPDML